MRQPVPYAVAAKALLHQTLFDAARDLMVDRTWNEVTMAQVAAAAGVSRQTLYNEFGSREAFAQAFVLGEVERFIGAIHDAVATNSEDPAKALAAAFEVFLLAAEHDPLVRSIVAGDGTDGLLALVTTHGQPVLGRATEQLSAVIEEHWPQADPADAAVLADSLVRLAISYAALPSTPGGLQGGEAVSTLLGPFIREALA